MKKSLVVLALLTCFGAQAQEANSGSQSGSTSGAQSGSISGVQSSNSGNTTAIGNANQSQSGSQSTSGASSGSQSGALGNAVYIDQSGPSSQTVNATSHSSVSGGTNNTDNVKYSGTVENRASGGYNNTDTINQNVHYSGTQTIKNVPGIAMSGPASGPCTGASGGLGIAGPGFGVGLNGAKVDDGCTVRENTRVLGQLYQSLASDNPAKAEAQTALLEGMAIIRNMNAAIGGSYAPPPAPKQAQATPAPAPVVATPTMGTNTVAAAASEPRDPYVRARLGLPALK